MTNKRREFEVGIRQRPSTTAGTQEGEERVDSGDNKKKVYLDGAERSMVSEDQTQTLTNKTINADNNTISELELDNLKSGVLDTDISAVSGSHDTIASALAIKTYIDNEIALKDQASEISYDNATSGLIATDVQAAIDEVEGRIDTLEGDTGLADHLADAVDAHDASAISNVPAGNLAATDVQGALNELQTDVDTRALDSDLTTHISDTTTHGVTGDILGSSDTQTVTNKTIDADLNTISNLAHGAEVDNPTSGVHGVTGNVVGTSDAQDLTNKTFADAIIMDEIATPSNPAVGENKLYFKSDGNLYKLDDTGTEVEVGSGGGGSVTVREEDGTPSVTASTIRFPNGTLTDNGGGDISYSGGLDTASLNLVANISYEQSSGVNGGDATAGSWLTYPTNTISGGTSFSGLSSNQITLKPGRYLIDFQANFYLTDRAAIKLRNITDGTDVLLGSNTYSNSAGTSAEIINSHLKGEFTITSEKVFEIQYRCTVTRATNGLGLQKGYGTNEIYGNGTITKLDGENLLMTASESVQPVRAYLSTNQTIANNTQTVIEIDTAEKDDDGLLDSVNYKLIVPKDGWYSISGQLNTSTASNGGRLSIYKNGSTALSNTADGVSSLGLGLHHTTTATAYLVAGDEITLQYIQVSGGNVTGGQGATNTWISMHRVDERALVNTNSVVVEEEDASPSVTASKIKFPNGTVTDNGDGSISYNGGISAFDLDTGTQLYNRDDSATTISNATGNVLFDSAEDGNADNFGDTGIITVVHSGETRFTAQKKCIVDISANMRITSNSRSVSLRWSRPGSFTDKVWAFGTVTGIADHWSHVSSQLELEAGDYFTFNAARDDGGADTSTFTTAFGNASVQFHARVFNSIAYASASESVKPLRVTATSATTLNNITNTTINWGTIDPDMDGDGSFDTSTNTWTCPKDGIYNVTWQIGMVATTSTYHVTSNAFLNGTTQIARDVTHKGNATSEFEHTGCSVNYKFTKGDTLTIRGSLALASLNTLTGQEHTFLNITRVDERALVNTNSVVAETEDASVSVTANKVKYPTGTLTDNGDGSVSYSGGLSPATLNFVKPLFVHATSSTTFNNASNTKVNFGTIDSILDGDGSFDTGTDTWTCPADGTYNISAQVTMQGTSEQYHLNLEMLLNGSTPIARDTTHKGTSNAEFERANVEVTRFFSQGDTVIIQGAKGGANLNTQNGQQYTYINVVKVDGENSVITPSTSNAAVRYTTNAGNNISNGTATFIDIEDISFDSDSLVTGAGSGNVTTSGTGWRYVSPRSGVLNVKGTLTLDMGSDFDTDESAAIRIYKAGSLYSEFTPTMQGSPNSGKLPLHIDDLVEVAQNDIIEIAVLQLSGATRPLTNAADENFVSIHYIDREPLIANPFQTKFQEKILGSTISTNATNIFTFNNLTIGKTYRLFTQLHANPTSGGQGFGNINHNGTLLASCGMSLSGGDQNGATKSSTEAVFTASATTVTVDSVIVGTASIIGSGDKGSSYAKLEELPNHVTTSEWT